MVTSSLLVEKTCGFVFLTFTPEPKLDATRGTTVLFTVCVSRQEVNHMHLDLKTAPLEFGKTGPRSDTEHETISAENGALQNAKDISDEVTQQMEDVHISEERRSKASERQLVDEKPTGAQ